MEPTQTSWNAETRVILVTGDDEAMIRERAEQIVRQIAGDEPDPFRFEVITEGDERSPAQTIRELLKAIESPSLLGGRRTVWLKHFSGFDAEGRKRDAGGPAEALAELAEKIKAGLPDDVTLIMDGPGVDRRRGLYRACEKAGTVVTCMRPDARNAEMRVQQMTEVIRQAAERKGVHLPPDVASYLARVVGPDTARIEPELEKLICFCGGPDAPITLEAAREVSTVELEAHGWDVSDALIAGDLARALRSLALVLDRERDPESAVLGLIVQIARSVREHLMVRVLARELGVRSTDELRNRVQGLDPELRTKYLDRGLDVVKSHPYRVLVMARAAVGVTDEFLITAHEILTRAYRTCLYSGEGRNRIVLEQAILETMRIHPRRTGRTARRRRTTTGKQVSTARR